MHYHVLYAENFRFSIASVLKMGLCTVCDRNKTKKLEANLVLCVFILSNYVHKAIKNEISDLQSDTSR